MKIVLSKLFNTKKIRDKVEDMVKELSFDQQIPYDIQKNQ